MTRERLKASEEKSPKEFLPLSNAVFHILITLAGGETHGYAIMQDVANRSRGAVRLGPGTMYGALGRLLEDGLIEECDGRPSPELDDDRRRYYRLTRRGGRVLTAETERLESLIHAARSTMVPRKMKPAQ